MTRTSDALKQWHDRLGAMIDQVGHPDYSLHALVDGLRAIRDEMFAASASAPLSETGRSTVAPHVDGQDFYELCQAYRHSKEIMPHGIPNTVQAFSDLREYIKTGKLPWPSYESHTGNSGEPQGER